MAKLTGNMIKAGLTVWAVGYVNNKGYKQVPVELEITSSVCKPVSGEVFFVTLAEPSNGIRYSGCCTFAPGALAIYPSDAGVRPYNYDSRATQVFTTKQDVEDALKLWAGRKPNFVTEEGETIEREPMDWLDDYCE